MMIEKESVVLRSQPATNSQAIDTIDINSTVNVISERNGWLRVRYKGTSEGWIPKWLLDNDNLVTDQNLPLICLLHHRYILSKLLTHSS